MVSLCLYILSLSVDVYFSYHPPLPVVWQPFVGEVKLQEWVTKVHNHGNINYYFDMEIFQSLSV